VRTRAYQTSDAWKSSKNIHIRKQALQLLLLINNTLPQGVHAPTAIADLAGWVNYSHIAISSHNDSSVPFNHCLICRESRLHFRPARGRCAARTADLADPRLPRITEVICAYSKDKRSYSWERLSNACLANVLPHLAVVRSRDHT